MNMYFPPVPQTGRQPVSLTSEQEQRLLSRRVAADRNDPFASDPNEFVRDLGKLALRRGVDDAADSFALGDLCALLTLANDLLRVSYAGKALIAYRRAAQQADSGLDRKVAESAIISYVRWVCQVAEQAPIPRNLAVALWVMSEIPLEKLPDDVRNTALRLVELHTSVLIQSSPTLSDARKTLELPGVSEKLLPGDAPDAPTRGYDPVPEKLTDTHPDIFDTQAGDPYVEEPDQAPGSDVVDMLSQTAGSDPSLPTVSHLTEVRDAPPGVVSNMNFDDSDFRSGETIINRYVVRNVIRGGMGIIYLCFDQDTQSTVAIKTFQGRLLENEPAVTRFIQEARTWIRLEKHPNIVQATLVKDMGSERVNERPHIVLEHVVGPEGLGSDLKSWIDHNRLDVEHSLQIALDICRGMQHAVRKVPGLVHRGLKPANILVRHDG